MTVSERLSQALTKIRGVLPSGGSLVLLQSRGGRRAVIAAIAIYLTLTLGLGFYWSMTPDSFDVVENRAKYLKSSDQSVTGAATTAALLEIGLCGSVFATGFVTSLAPITKATSAFAKSPLQAPFWITCLTGSTAS